MHRGTGFAGPLVRPPLGGDAEGGAGGQPSFSSIAFVTSTTPLSVR